MDVYMRLAETVRRNIMLIWSMRTIRPRINGRGELTFRITAVGCSGPLLEPTAASMYLVATPLSPQTFLPALLSTTRERIRGSLGQPWAARAGCYLEQHPPIPSTQSGAP